MGPLTTGHILLLVLNIETMLQMHVLVQEMQVCCVQQMGTHTRVCVGVQRAPAGTEMQQDSGPPPTELPL